MDIQSHNLNRYTVEMVDPDKCIRNRNFFHNSEAGLCDACFLCNGDKCEYELISVDVANGSYEEDWNEWRKYKYNYSQFCCPECGELISRHSTYTVGWTDSTGADVSGCDIQCEKCKTQYVGLKEDYRNSKLLLARKPKVK